MSHVSQFNLSLAGGRLLLISDRANLHQPTTLENLHTGVTLCPPIDFWSSTLGLLFTRSRQPHIDLAIKISSKLRDGPRCRSTCSGTLIPACTATISIPIRVPVIPFSRYFFFYIHKLVSGARTPQHALSLSNILRVWFNLMRPPLPD